MNKDNNKNNEKEKSKKLLLSLIGLIILLVIVIAGIIIYNQNNEEDENTLAYTDLIKEISYGNVEKVELTTGSRTAKITIRNEEEEKTAIIPDTEAFITLIQTKVAEGNEIELIQKPQSFFAQLPTTLFSILPTIIMVALFIMIFKMQGMGEKGKVYDETERKTKVRFDDVAGLEEEKGELIEIVDFLKRPEKYTKMGARVPKGVLLYGKPGTGKTLQVKQMCHLFL